MASGKNNAGSDNGVCALCGREERLTRHHNKRNKREFERAAVKAAVGLCRPFHAQVHALFTENELEWKWNTVGKLREHPDVARFVAWMAGKRQGFRMRVRSAEGGG